MQAIQKSQPVESQNQRTQHIYTCLAVLLLFTAGLIRHDFGGVPFTMQTMVVYLIAMCYERKQALQVMMLYIAMSTSITPWFNGGQLITATFGYLIGFFLATAWIQYDKLKNAHFSVSRLAISLGVAQLLVWLSGYIWLAQLTDYTIAFYTGVVPFVLTDLVKVLLALGVKKALVMR